MNTSTTSYIPVSTPPLTTVVTRKGQVTIPAPIRDALGIKQGDSVTFQLENDEITVKPVSSTLAEGYQSIPALKKPLTWKEMKEIIRDDVAEAYTKKFR